MSSSSMTVKLKVWRQEGPDAPGRLVDYSASGISPDMSFLEMLDVGNDGLVRAGKDPIAFDSDCREGICGSCGCVINGVPHGPDRGGATETTAPTQPGESTQPSVPDLPPQSPGPTGGPPPAELSPQQPPAGGWETTLPRPRAIVLPHDLDVAQHSEESDWQEVSGQASWLLLPCDAASDVGYPSDGSRTAHAVIGQSGIESFSWSCRWEPISPG